MAKLSNISKDVFIIITLKMIKDSPEWIGYDLKILTGNEKDEKQIMRLYFADNLFLENFAELEIPTLCNSLNLITAGIISNYTFEPIDEKDFCLEITANNDNFFRITLFLRYPEILESYLWNSRSSIGVKMNVNKEDLVNFSSDLKKEYELLFPPQKLLTSNN